MPLHRSAFKLAMTGQGGHPVMLPKTTIQAVFKKSSLYVILPVNSVLIKFLADSGAEISVLPEGHEAIPPECSLNPIQVQPVTADGKPLETVGTVSLPVLINNISVDVLFYISRSTISPILGVDVMRQFQQVSLDFENGTVKFGGHRGGIVPEHEVLKEPRVCRVVLPRDVVIPPRHEVMVSGMLEVKDPLSLKEFAGQTCVLESHIPPGHVRSQLKGASVLGIVHEGVFPVRICNPFQTEVSLKGQSEVGSLTMLDNNPVVSVLGESDDVSDVLSSPDKPREILNKLAEEAEVDGCQKRELSEFLRRYQSVFSLEGELGRFEGQPFKIDTGNASPGEDHFT